MLEQLKLSNLALSVQAEVDFTPGMICITGETGAGKSLVVDALGLVLGSKADANMVRQGEKQLEVSAQFSIENNARVIGLLGEYGFLDDKVPYGSAAARAAAANARPQTTIPADLNALAHHSHAATPDQAQAYGQGLAQGQGQPQPESVAAGTEGSAGLSMTAQASDAPAGADESADTAAAAVAAAAEAEAAAMACDQADGQAVGLEMLSTAEICGDLVLRRVVTAEGKSKAYINGHMATLTQLRDLGEHLVAIHGQHASVRLMDEKHQLETVDNFGKLRPLVNEVNTAFNNYQKLRQDLVKLSDLQKQGAATYRQDRYDLEELRRLDFQEGDYENLEAMFDRAMHQAQFSYILAQFRAIVEGGDSNVVSILRERLMEMDKVKAFDPDISRIMENIESAILHLEEGTSIAEDLASQGMEMSTNELEGKMSKAHDLARRFSCLPRELYLMSDRIERKVTEFLGLKDRITAMTEEVRKARAEYEAAASRLSEARIKAAAELSASISGKITTLAMPDARFDIQIRRDEEGRPRLGGRDELCFMFSANLGQDLRPLAAVASGGELSRLALAIEVLTASVKSTPTLIFDEVDTGISGRTASAVGDLLQELGQYVQVITVTHLPQVAAKAHTQFVVAKFNEQGGVNSTITMLDSEGRIEEISRMIGGSVITETTRRSAYELLNETL
ncbi:DNA repair protein RecN [Anaerobiospirillum sp. NML120449]|uniref:DNA repair protein RecN n=1 Tax=Anaerobiospirillum sp. NML120449 TaxID=2932817 RepID=UPI001FF2A3FB|nr:DNA repair protein RecN [Anaerobiospirillum sp. NML120449]MCK0525947.1 DNA repair protein RecN [Anaerobiospirillum sp. NML120449]